MFVAGLIQAVQQAVHGKQLQVWEQPQSLLDVTLIIAALPHQMPKPGWTGRTQCIHESFRRLAPAKCR